MIPIARPLLGAREDGSISASESFLYVFKLVQASLVVYC